MRYSFKVGALCTALLSMASAASAASVTLTYDINGSGTPGGVLEAILDGTLLGDGNTFLPTSVQDFATFDGVNAPTLPFVVAADAFGGLNPAAVPTLTLDGSFIDVFACFDAGCTEGFGFAVASLVSGISGDIFVLDGGPFPDNTSGPFNVGDYTATLNPMAPIPLPAGGTLALSALVGLGLLRRRQNAA